MKLLTLSLLAALLLAACSNPSTTAPTPTEAEAPTQAVNYQALLDSFYTRYPSTKGILMHVEAPNHGISWTGATGTDTINHRDLSPSDPALIASNTKTYIAAAMLRLVEQGHLKIHQPIAGLISSTSDSLLRSDGYQPDSITVAHLLSHTSGLFDYCDSPEFKRIIIEETDHYFTRNEQIAMGIRDGDPLGPPGFTFSYADQNYLLLTEILEHFTGQPFHTATRQLLKYDQLALNETWWNLLEPAPTSLPPLMQQFATKLGGDSYVQHATIDLYGGGGIASTVKDLALFSQHLFEGRVFDAPETSKLLFTEMPTQDSVQANYYLGIDHKQLAGMDCYGHGGFWGTHVKYFPAINTSIAVFLRERDEWQHYLELMEIVAGQLSEEGQAIG